MKASLFSLFVCMSWAQAATFESVYTDSSNGLSWSKKLPGTYSNGSPNICGNYELGCPFETDASGNRYVVVETSDAAKACRDIGGRLPTKQELESLMRNFDYIEAQYGPQLTKKGIADMQAIFGEMVFWSSSVHPRYNNIAFDFGGLHDYLGGIGLAYRSYKQSVRCVAGL